MTDLEQAEIAMKSFADRTGVSGGVGDRRYLWTDAFAVTNFVGLARTTGKAEYTDLAVALVDRVHHTLGKHRPDSPRHGWLSGEEHDAGEQHPTRGGLRIGKRLPERARGEPRDERLEWHRDGQYFHYLTKWMHALARVSAATGSTAMIGWARELCGVAHRAFTYVPDWGGHRRMYWKMSSDLSRPLVAAMGQHDPLDGYLTALELDAGKTPPTLARVSDDYRQMIDLTELTTEDPLGLGGLLWDASRVGRLTALGALPDDTLLLSAILGAAEVGLQGFRAQWEHDAPARGRLPFRELGLSIGFHAAARLAKDVDAGLVQIESRDRKILDRVVFASKIGRQIEQFWLRPESRSAIGWVDHVDINEVMLATSLAPEGFLGIEPVVDAKTEPAAESAHRRDDVAIP
jgi:hypothetical protein